MPNQRDPSKIMVGGYIPDDVAAVGDDIARKHGLRSRAELIEWLIREAARREGAHLREPESAYAVDKARRRGRGSKKAAKKATKKARK